MGRIEHAARQSDSLPVIIRGLYPLLASFRHGVRPHLFGVFSPRIFI